MTCSRAASKKPSYRQGVPRALMNALAICAGGFSASRSTPGYETTSDMRLSLRWVGLGARTDILLRPRRLRALGRAQDWLYLVLGHAATVFILGSPITRYRAVPTEALPGSRRG